MSCRVNLIRRGTRIAACNTVVKVRLTKKLALRMDGVDVSTHRVGDILELPAEKARVLVAEDWATAEERRRKHLANPPIERRRRSTPGTLRDLQ